MCRDIHAMTGCDSTSALFRKGKKKGFNVLRKSKNLHERVEVFNTSCASKECVAAAGESFLLALYGEAKCRSLNELRFFAYKRATARLSLQRKFDLASLPPTSDAARQHSFRVYVQVQKWLGFELSRTDWGWKLESGGLHPIASLLPPAPDNLLNLISCNCKGICSTSACECRRSGIQCSGMCGHCRGISCKNAAQNDEESDSSENED